MRQVVCVAFLQNQWFKDPVAAKASFESLGEAKRHRLIAYALFAGCLSGRRIKAAFGDRIDKIIWEEASPEICGEASACPPADLEHVRKVLERHNPDFVLTFGEVARQALVKVWSGMTIAGPHPAARLPFVDSHIASMARMYDEAVKSVEAEPGPCGTGNETVQIEMVKTRLALMSSPVVQRPEENC